MLLLRFTTDNKVRVTVSATHLTGECVGVSTYRNVLVSVYYGGDLLTKRCVNFQSVWYGVRMIDILIRVLDFIYGPRG